MNFGKEFELHQPIRESAFAASHFDNDQWVQSKTNMKESLIIALLNLIYFLFLSRQEHKNTLIVFFFPPCVRKKCETGSCQTGSQRDESTAESICRTDSRR